MAGILYASVRTLFDAVSILSGLNNLTTKMRKESLTKSSSTLRGVAKVQHEDSELIFGENMAKQMSEYKASMKSVGNPQGGQDSGYSKNGYGSSKYQRI